MVIGTSTGFTKTLNMIGVGYRASTSGNQLTLNLGYSHPVVMDIPTGLKVEVRLHFYALPPPSSSNPKL
jgi:large subunit ribosomal protein L6